MSLSQLNTDSKAYEKHLEINLLVDGVEVSGIFEGFTDYSLDRTCFTIRWNEGDSRVFHLSFDYKEGQLADMDGNQSIEVDDLFSNRHLQSLLFFARDYAFMEKDAMNETTRRLHASYPVPQMWTEVNEPYMRRKFKIDNILKSNGKEIVLDGVLSMSSGDSFMLPFYAQCRYSVKKQLYQWTYMMGGQEWKVEDEEWNHSSEINMPSTFLFDLARQMAITKKTAVEMDVDENILDERKVLDIFNERLFRFISDERKYMEVAGTLSVIVTGIKSITPLEVEFTICNGSQLNDSLIYDRQTKRFFHLERYSSRKKRRHYRFIRSEQEGPLLFEQVLKIID